MCGNVASFAGNAIEQTRDFVEQVRVFKIIGPFELVVVAFDQPTCRVEERDSLLDTVQSVPAFYAEI